MKYFYTVLALILAISVNLSGQTNLISDDFETYTAGQKLVQQAPSSWWTTWSNSPGSAEDPVVSTEQAYNGTKTVKVVTNNDLVLKLDDNTTGRYQIEFFMFVATGKLGYFNILHDFAGSNSEWGLQIYFNSDGTGTVDANGEGAASFTYSLNAWTHVNVIIDLDDDFTTFYVNDNEVVSYQWSKGAFGQGTMNKLDGVNFYGWTDSGVQGLYYVDQVRFNQMLPADPPQNLTATVNNSDIDLAWDPPASGTPASYSIMRNGVIIATGISGTSYTDVYPYPNNYVYTVRAHYAGLGYSPSSNTATAEITGGVDRNLVLYEIVTGTWCVYCPGAAKGADDLVSNGHDVAILEYHGGDSYEIPESAARINFYGVTSYPTTKVDGILGFSGGNATTSIYPSYLAIYNQRKPVPSVHILNMDIVKTSTDNYTATITVEQTNPYFSGSLYLMTALTESHIPVNWYGGLHEVNFVCRGMYPSANGSFLDFSQSSMQTVIVNFSTAGFVLANCEFIAFVQHKPSWEVIQTAKEAMLYVGLENLEVNEMMVYPNPASDKVNIRLPKAQTSTYTITDLVGKIVVPATKVSQKDITLNVSSWKPGIYMLKTDAGLTTKFVIAR